MEMSVNSPDTIELSLPYKAEYVSVARLTTSGIASRAGFDIETVEDIKVAVSEVCNRIISISAGLDGHYRIIFELHKNEFVIKFTSDNKKIKCIFDDDENGLGISIIKAFMDNVEFCPHTSGYTLTMSKVVEVVSDNGL